jgi:CRP/FNR family transcriptional regulator, nitrogen oxide reductase regulator
MALSPEEFDVIAAASLFRGLDREEIEEVVAAADLRTVTDGAFFFLEEDSAQHAYILLDGKVKLTQVTTDGQQVILGYLVPGRVYGVIAVLKKVAFPVSAQAVGISRALSWDHQTMNKVMEKYPRMALNALRIMAVQIREFQNRVRELSTQQVEQRVALAVLRLARQSGKKTEQGVLIDLPLSRQDLAEMTGTTLYTVSRVLTVWEKKGLVQSKRQQVTITKPHGLVVIAENMPLTDGETQRLQDH